MFHVYILYSESADKYYIGHTDNVQRRLEEHNNADKNSYTSRYRPWTIKGSFIISDSRSEARRVENYLKRLRSRKFIERLLAHPEEFEVLLMKVRAVPTHRD